VLLLNVDPDVGLSSIQVLESLLKRGNAGYAMTAKQLNTLPKRQPAIGTSGMSATNSCASGVECAPDAHPTGGHTRLPQRFWLADTM
jgi:hypothetical protein